ncbi:MAG: PorT family protein [Cyclobacteriaceae bacterium]|nr:PorT family protein [Cyclobacteriaceae bacterium]
MSQDQNVITYDPTHILGYGFEDDKVFQSREVFIKDQQPKIVFLEVIVRGLASLYKFEKIYFIEKNDSGPQQLVNETKEVFVDGMKVLKSTNQYINTINNLLLDCPDIQAKLQRTKLEEKDLVSLIKDYNTCKGKPSLMFKSKKPQVKALIGVIGGVNISEISFEAFSGFEYLTSDFDLSISPMLGVSLNLLFPRVSERISLQTDIILLSSKYYNYTLIESLSSAERNYVTIELKQLKIPIGVRYTFPRRAFTPYFNLGVSSTLNLAGSDSEWVREVESNGVVNTTTNKALVFSQNQFGIWGGLGVSKGIRKLNAFVELRYEQTNGIVSSSEFTQRDLRSTISNAQIAIGLRTN